MTNRYKTWLVIILTVFMSCTYENELDLYGTTSCQTDDMSYTLDISPIISATCFPCHTRDRRDGNVILEGYENLLVQIDRGRLLGAIRHEEGFVPMPQGKPKLVDCEIEKIESWIAEGSPNN